MAVHRMWPGLRYLRHGVTVNTAELDAVPPAVVTAILPVYSFLSSPSTCWAWALTEVDAGIRHLDNNLGADSGHRHSSSHWLAVAESNATLSESQRGQEQYSHCYFKLFHLLTWAFD